MYRALRVKNSGREYVKLRRLSLSLASIRAATVLVRICGNRQCVRLLNNCVLLLLVPLRFRSSLLRTKLSH